MNESVKNPERDSAAPLVRIRGLRFARGARVILQDLDMDVPQGGVTAIMGPSGCGKTTLIRLISGQLRQQRGSIQIDGLEVSQLRRRQLWQLRRRMGVLFQNGALLTDLSVFENVAFPLREHTELPEELLRSLVLMKLESVGLRGAADLYPAELSGGMARRVALARATAMDPELVMYDEPFSGQDPISMGVLVRLISRMRDYLDVTGILVSHDVAETMSIADHVFLLSHQGQLIAHGTPEQIRSDDSPWVRQFLEALADGPVAFHYPAPELDRQLMGP